MIHVSRDGKEIGQYSVSEINKSLTAGTLLKTDWAWYEGAAEWVQITEVEGVEIEAENSFNKQDGEALRKSIRNFEAPMGMNAFNFKVIWKWALEYKNALGAVFLLGVFVVVYLQEKARERQLANERFQRSSHYFREEPIWPDERADQKAWEIWKELKPYKPTQPIGTQGWAIASEEYVKRRLEQDKKLRGSVDKWENRKRVTDALYVFERGKISFQFSNYDESGKRITPLRELGK